MRAWSYIPDDSIRRGVGKHISSGRLVFLQCFFAFIFANNGQLIVGGNPTEM